MVDNLIVVTIKMTRYITKAGIAHRAVKKRNENNRHTMCIAPWSKEHPSNKFVCVLSTMGTAASPNVRTTIRAARCLNLRCSVGVMVRMDISDIVSLVVGARISTV